MPAVDCKHCQGTGNSPYVNYSGFPCHHCSGTGTVTEPCPRIDENPADHEHNGCTLCANSGYVSKMVYYAYLYGPYRRKFIEKREQLLEERKNYGSC